MEDSARDKLSGEQIIRNLTKWLVFFGTTLFGAVFLLGATTSIYYEPWVLDLAREHFAATVGLPFAALAALCLVILLEINTGKIEMRGLGFEFKGAAGPLIMWIFCFLAIAGAIKMLW